MPFYLSSYRPSLPLQASISKGMRVGWYAKLSWSAKPRVPPSIPLLPLFSPLSFLLPVLPYPLCPSLHAWVCVMNSSADKSDLSSCHRGREGRWTVECPGTESREGLWAQCYASSHIPCCACSRPLQLCLPVCFHDPCNAPIGPLTHSCLTCTNQTHPGHQSSNQAAQSCNNTAPGLTRSPPHPPSSYKPR